MSAETLYTLGYRVVSVGDGRGEELPGEGDGGEELPGERDGLGDQTALCQRSIQVKNWAFYLRLNFEEIFYPGSKQSLFKI